MKRKSVVCFGEVLWDNFPEGRNLGGAPLNVCYHLNRSGTDSKIITKIGIDQNGRDILDEFKKLNISTAYCQISENSPTSTVEVFLNEDNEVSYEIVENVAWDEIKVSEVEVNLVKDADALVFGSLVARTATSRESLFKLIGVASYRVFDVNLRHPYYSKELISSLLDKTNLLKLNEDELHILKDWFGFEAAGYKNLLASLPELFPSIQEILLTRGAKGSVYYSSEEYHEVSAIEIKILNTVGSGDAFLAAFLAARLNDEPVKKALYKANILSGFVATHTGACPAYTTDSLYSMYND